MIVGRKMEAYIKKLHNKLENEKLHQLTVYIYTYST